MVTRLAQLQEDLAQGTQTNSADGIETHSIRIVDRLRSVRSVRSLKRLQRAQVDYHHEPAIPRH